MEQELRFSNVIRILRRPNVALGCALMLTGLVLCAPLAWVRIHHRLANGVLLAVYPDPETADSDRVRLLLSYEFPIAELSGRGQQVHGMGFRRRNALGLCQDGFTVSRAAATETAESLLSRRPWPVFYDPRRPFQDSAIYLGAFACPLSRDPWWLYHLGLVLVVSPIMAWCMLTMLRHLDLGFARRRTASSRRKDRT